MQNQVKYQVSAQFCMIYLGKALESLDAENRPVTLATPGGTIHMARTYPWKVSDAFWEHVKPLLPAAPSHAKGGRPRMDDRRAFEAIVYVLRTGIQWNALPKEPGASSTVHDRFQEWEQAGVFKAL